MMGRSVGQHLQVVGRILEPERKNSANENRLKTRVRRKRVKCKNQPCHLVMGGHVESHQPLQEGLRSLVVTEQSVSVHIISGR